MIRVIARCVSGAFVFLRISTKPFHASAGIHLGGIRASAPGQAPVVVSFCSDNCNCDCDCDCDCGCICTALALALASGFAGALARDCWGLAFAAARLFPEISTAFASSSSIRWWRYALPSKMKNSRRTSSVACLSASVVHLQMRCTCSTFAGIWRFPGPLSLSRMLVCISCASANAMHLLYICRNRALGPVIVRHQQKVRTVLLKA